MKTTLSEPLKTSERGLRHTMLLLLPRKIPTYQLGQNCSPSTVSIIAIKIRPQPSFDISFQIHKAFFYHSYDLSISETS